MYKKYLNKSKECGIDTGCFNGVHTHLNNTTADYDTNVYTLILADGTEISFGGTFRNDCSA